jgi:hypothetical protein
MLHGRCLCETVRYELRGDPIAMYYCHCAQCRRATGSSFATNLIVRSDDLHVVAGEAAMARYESSPGKFRHFCSRCGSPIFSRSDSMPHISSLRAGTLDEDPGLRPATHIWVSAKAPWLEIQDELPQRPEGLT